MSLRHDVTTEPAVARARQPTTNPRVSRRAWLTLGLATVTAALTGPGQTIGVSVFVDRFVDDLGLTRDQVSTAYLVGTLVGAALLPWVGRSIDRRGVRTAQIAIGIGFALALVNMSLVNGLIWLAVGFAGIRFLGQGSLSLVSTVTVSLAFRERRGTALGIFATVTAGLMALVPVGLSIVIDGIGWRRAWLVSAAVVALTVVPIAIFGLRSMPRGTNSAPADPGHHPDRDPTHHPDRDPTHHPDRDPTHHPDRDPTHHPAQDAATIGADFTRREALATRSFWMIASVSGSAGLLATALNFHQIDLMGDSGISETVAATLFLPQVLGSTVSGLTVGYLADRLGLRYLPAASMALLTLALVLGAVITPGPVVVVYSVVLGAMGGAVRTASSTLLPGWFGTTHLGAIQGALTFFNVGASAVGPVLLSVTRGWFDDYTPAILILTVIPVAAGLFSLLPDHRRRTLA